MMIPNASSPKLCKEMQDFLFGIGIQLVKYDAVIQQTYTPGLYHPTHVAITQSAFLNAQLATKIEKQKITDEVNTEL